VVRIDPYYVAWFATNGPRSDRRLTQLCSDLAADYISLQRRWREEQEKALLNRQKLFAQYAERLADGKGGFRDSVAQGLRIGSPPRGRGRCLAAHILAEQVGSEGSTVYEEEYERIMRSFEEAKQ